MRKKISTLLRFFCVLALLGVSSALFTSCDASKEIVSNIDERESNIILVLLESRGIPASKTPYSSGNTFGSGDGSAKFSIVVPESHFIDAIAFLNQNGFPRQKGTTLLDLFAKQGLMTSDKEETIRYQAGLAQELTNTILMIDGVIDATVQLSFPPEQLVIGGNENQERKITASVYVKHQGIIDDPNVHLENRIRRLVAGSISGLDINDVTIVSDRSRFTDVSPNLTSDLLGGNHPIEYVSIWSIIMSKESATRFRFLFFFISALALLFALILGWLLWKLYPTLKKKGIIKELFSPIPLISGRKKDPKPPDEQ